jgi:hypothetical protein
MIRPGQHVSWMSKQGRRLHGHVVKPMCGAQFYVVQTKTGVRFTVSAANVTREMC